MKKQGFAKIAAIYFTNYLSIVFRGKASHNNYQDIR